MSDKDAAKRRRQARNRQERINRQKRTEGARKPEPSRSSRSAGTAGRDGRPSRAANPAPASGGFLGKLFPPRPAPAAKGEGEGGESARPQRVAQPRESVVYDVDTGGATGLRLQVVRHMAQPGGRATTIALVLSVVVAVMLFTAPLALRPAFPATDVGTATELGEGAFAEMVVRAVPGTEAELTERLEALEDSDPVAFGTERFTEVLSPVVIGGFALVLILITATAFRSLTRTTRSRTLMISSFALVGVMFFSALGQVLLPLVAALAFASYQSRKADRMAVVQGDPS